jgi:hypothetical protein
MVVPQWSAQPTAGPCHAGADHGRDIPQLGQTAAGPAHGRPDHSQGLSRQVQPMAGPDHFRARPCPNQSAAGTVPLPGQPSDGPCQPTSKSRSGQIMARPAHGQASPCPGWPIQTDVGPANDRGRTWTVLTIGGPAHVRTRPLQVQAKDGPTQCRDRPWPSQSAVMADHGRANSGPGQLHAEPALGHISPRPAKGQARSW